MNDWPRPVSTDHNNKEFQMSLKLGVIGTGAIGQDHIRRCSQTLLNSQVVAVTDINLAQAAKVVADLKLTAEVYPDGHALIKAPEVEAILVTSWGPSHEEFVLAAIAAGKPVFCEKPLAVTAEGCRRIVEAEVPMASDWCRSVSCARTTRGIGRSRR
jgi:myo-inositol 2-dehydrogenase/D-chiro-inositol 1-dehydrogenase